MQKAKLAVLTLLAAALSIRCSSEIVGVQEITGLPRDLTAAEQELIRSDNAFGLKLFREIHAWKSDDANIFISPLSVAMALAMTYNGAVGETQQAMQQTLELQDLTIDEVNQSYRGLIDLLRSLDSTVEFLLANSIWYRQGFPVVPDFLDVNRTYFDAEVAALDFGAPDAAATINAWVNEQTRGKIEEIVDDPIPWDVVMYLIDAIYFKGTWTIEFDPDLTADRPFYLADGGEKLVPMMTYPEVIDVAYYATEEVEAIDLPYGGEAFSMTIVMPAGDGEIGSLIQSLDAERWSEIIAGLTKAELNVLMPKFSLEYEDSLKNVLEALGMGIAFTPASDFTKLSPADPWIDQVKHKAFIEVDEHGTEAAAVTSVTMVLSGRPTVRVNRPFVFAIREKFSGTILFMGLVMEP
jgi:serine protease inhibitor